MKLSSMSTSATTTTATPGANVLPTASERGRGRSFTPEFVHFCRQHPRLGEKLVLLRSLVVHSRHEHREASLRHKTL